MRVLSSVWRSLESPGVAEARPGRTMVGENLREEARQPEVWWSPSDWVSSERDTECPKEDGERGRGVGIHCSDLSERLDSRAACLSFHGYRRWRAHSGVSMCEGLWIPRVCHITQRELCSRVHMCASGSWGWGGMMCKQVVCTLWALYSRKMRTHAHVHSRPYWIVGVIWQGVYV